MSTYLITGMAGSLAQLVCKSLLAQGHEVIGVDHRPRPAYLPDSYTYYQGNYNKAGFEDVIRRHRPEVMVHLGRVGNLKMQVGKRFDLNVIGTGKVMELSLKYGVDRLLVLSTFHIYGAHANNHIPIFEDEPLRAGSTFPQIADAVQLDNMAQQWIYRHPKLRTIVLRPCNIIGPDIRNAISRYLRNPRLFYIFGFSPMWQFIHQDDMVRAILSLLDHGQPGVYNAAGAGAIPLVDALAITGKPVSAVPGPLASTFLTVQSRFKSAFPPYLLDFFRYHCVISDDKLRKAIGYEPRVGITEAIQSCVQGPSPASSN
jgi:UDP-glucose 4-epimerase